MNLNSIGAGSQTETKRQSHIDAGIAGVDVKISQLETLRDNLLEKLIPITRPSPTQTPETALPHPNPGDGQTEKLDKEDERVPLARIMGKLHWRTIFDGIGIDVGAGNDPLPFDDCLAFDQENGDANKLSSYFPAKSFDYLHASQCLEHMHDPRVALTEWLKVVKPGGFVICTVPDWVAYEGMQWPSQKNDDHKSTWSMIYKGSPAAIHIHIPSFLAEFPVKALLARFVDTNYDYKIGAMQDQSLPETAGVECWNEFVIQKL